MLLFTPNRLPRGTAPEVAHSLADAVCQHWGAQGMELAQFLLDPNDEPITQLYSSCGFEVLAELIYMQRQVKDAPASTLPQGFDVLSYTPALHDSFCRAIQRSYEGSLDCPALNGRRSIEDVITGHMNTGIFEPALWHLLRENGQDRGVLILSPSPHNDAVELVYLGLCPEARGRHLGDALMKMAAEAVLRHRRSELTLAVDSLNTPALRLYYRHGLKRIGSRMALLRDIRQSGRKISLAAE